MKKVQGTTLKVLIFLLPTVTALSFYGAKYITNLNRDKRAVQTIEDRLLAIPELEEDIFFKCAEETNRSEAELAYCQLNTSITINELVSDLNSQKQYIEEKTITDRIK